MAIKNKRQTTTLQSLWTRDDDNDCLIYFILAHLLLLLFCAGFKFTPLYATTTSNKAIAVLFHFIVFLFSSLLFDLIWFDLIYSFDIIIFPHFLFFCSVPVYSCITHTCLKNKKIKRTSYVFLCMIVSLFSVLFYFILFFL